MTKRDELAFVARVTGFSHYKKNDIETTTSALEHGGDRMSDRTPPMSAHVVVEGDLTVKIDELFEVRLTRRVVEKAEETVMAEVKRRRPNDEA